MIKIKEHIGIDPDLKKSGVAIWDSELKQFNLVELMTFWEIINKIQHYDNPIEIVIEAGWLNAPKNFHNKKIEISASKAADKLKLIGTAKESYIKNYIDKVGERVSANVGENHAVGKLLEQYCQYKNIRYKLIKPTTTKEYRKHIINKLGKNNFKNEELIDAAFLVFKTDSII